MYFIHCWTFPPPFPREVLKCQSPFYSSGLYVLTVLGSPLRLLVKRIRQLVGFCFALKDRKSLSVCFYANPETDGGERARVASGGSFKMSRRNNVKIRNKSTLALQFLPGQGTQNVYGCRHSVPFTLHFTPAEPPAPRHFWVSQWTNFYGHNLDRKTAK